MILMIASHGDIAGMNILQRLQEATSWTKEAEFRGNPVLRNGDLLLTMSETPHLHADNIDREFALDTGSDISEVVFLSKHKAASGIRTLTVHPIGNYHKAEFGGRDGELVPTSPSTMSGLLRALTRHAIGLPFKVSYEVTHHGPWLETPSLFIEIGSAEEDWGHKEAAMAIASSLLSFERRDDKVVIGVGGGHYAPRFTELTLSKKVSFGHMVPGHALDRADDKEIAAILKRAAMASGTENVYIHRKSFSGTMARKVKEVATNMGMHVIESSDLPDLLT
ncbi:MAG: hypothetical protein HPY73_06955 [Methanomassiliicoccales archaeon]|nr:MAG: hypothetical protein HPY73_06955 [Methanomassiliicoccales archaeon]